jgi:hypothetical protein
MKRSTAFAIEATACLVRPVHTMENKDVLHHPTDNNVFQWLILLGFLAPLMTFQRHAQQEQDWVAKTKKSENEHDCLAPWIHSPVMF